MFLRRLTWCVLTAATAVLAGAPAASGQGAPDREGFFIGVGLGFGSLGIEGAEGREDSASGYLKVGTALGDRLLLGAEANGWRKDDLGTSLTAGHLNGMAYFYPSGDGSLYVKGGFGVATVDLGAGVLGGGAQTGGSLTVGAGYDIGFDGRFSFSPYANYLYGRFDGGSTNLIQVGLGANWY